MNVKKFLHPLATIVLLLAMLFPLSVNAAPAVLYAKPGGLTSGSCDSWANACELQYALTSAVFGQEIWVRGGVYKPGGGRTDTFRLKSGVGIYGGFAGTETAREERNWETNKTILSGDIDNNDINTDGNFIAETTADIQGENTYHVVTGNYTDNTAMLDGFIITAGQANGSYSDGSGGGMLNYSGNLTLNNVTFSANLAYYRGGGMLNDGKPTLTNVVFLENSADKQGGGMCNEGFSQPVLTNVSFSGNTAAEGGGICIYQGSNPILKNVTFSANSATFGGGMMISNSGYTSAAISLLNSSFFDTVA